MKNLLLLLCCFAFATYNITAQERPLTKKIVTTFHAAEGKVVSSQYKDSISYDYKVNKRFFFAAMDTVFHNLKDKKISLYTFDGKKIDWDTMINSLIYALKSQYGTKYDKNTIQKIFDEQIYEVDLMEEWTYDVSSMLVNKKIIAYQPIVCKDSVALVGEDLKSVPEFRYRIGWIYPDSIKLQTKNEKQTQKSEIIPEQNLLISRNVQYTMSIYNPKPYHWWDNNLEAEYSLRFFDMLMMKAENLMVPCYDDPNATIRMTKPAILKRREHHVSVSLVKDLGENNTSETDTTIYMQYNSEDISYLRFGEEIVFDTKSMNFIKNVNYLAPCIAIYGDKNDFHGYYPLYYIRKER